MVTWQMTSRDPKRSSSWPRYLWSVISRQPCEIHGWLILTTNRKLHLENPVVTWPMMSRDPKGQSRDPIPLKLNISKTVRSGWIATKLAHDGHSIARIHGLLKVKVKVKGHVIRTLLWCHEMFAIQYRLTFCLYMHSLYEVPLHSPTISVRQPDVMSTSWNELLRRFRCVISPLIWYINFSFVHLQYITSYVRS